MARKKRIKRVGRAIMWRSQLQDWHALKQETDGSVFNSTIHFGASVFRP
jgi:hypothetical protein